MLDCFSSSQKISDEDYSIVNISTVVLYMSAKYDMRTMDIDFYTFFH